MQAQVSPDEDTSGAPKATQSAAAEPAPPVEQSTSDRLRLRGTLLASAVFLLILALLTYAFAGIQWAAPPLALAIMCGLVAMGRLSAQSRALLMSDIKALLSGLSAPTAEAPRGPLSATPTRSAGQPAAADISASQQPSPADAICGECGAQNPPDYRFCAECGIALEEHAATAQPTAVQSTPAQSTSAQSAIFHPVSAPAAPPQARDAAIQPASSAPSAFRFPERELGMGLLSAGLLLAALSLYMFPQGPPNTLAWWSYGMSVILTLGAIPAFEGVWSALFARFGRGYRVSFEPRALLPWAALCIILLLGLAIRLYDLDGFPAGLWYDEADLIDEATRIANDPGSMPVFVAFQNLPSMMSALTALQIKFTGISIYTGRLVAVLFGLAGIVAMFLLVRYMAGTAMGLVAAFLTAVMRWDIIWSRVGLHGITAPFFAALSAWLTYRAIRSERASDFALAGAALGLGMWFYSPFRLFPIVIGFVLLHALIFAKSNMRVSLLRNIAIMALLSFVFAAPVVQVAVVYPDEFFDRTNHVLISNFVDEEETTSALIQNLRKHLLMFHVEGDPNGRHNIPRAPMLDMFSGVLMLLGLAVALYRWRNVAYIVLPLWAVIMIMPGVLTIPWEAPQSLRSITVIPAVIALITIGIGLIWKLGSSAQLPAARIGTAAVIAALLAAIAYTNLHAYFSEQAGHPEVYSAFSTMESISQADMEEQSARGYIPLVSKQLNVIHPTYMNIYGGRLLREAIAAPASIPIAAEKAWRGAAIYIEPRESGFYDALKAYYPSAEYREVRPPAGGDALYYSAYISREELEAAQGLMERRKASDGKVVERVRKSTESAWALEADSIDAPFDVEWAGALHITQPGEYVFALESNSAATVILDGQAILSNKQPQVKIEPAVGLHSLEVRSQVKESDGVLRLLWLPPAPPDKDETPKDGEETPASGLQPIPTRNLYHGDVRPIGLAGRFFRGLEGAEQIGDAIPDAMRVTPGLGGAFWYAPVLEDARFAVWDGSLLVPETGSYRFRLGEVHGELRMIIDEYIVVDTRAERDATVELLEGRHRIRLEYLIGGGWHLFEALWTPPGQGESRIGPEYLSPAPEYMFRVEGQ